VKQITENVFVEIEKRGDYDSMPGCNFGFVVTSEGIVMIDGPSRPGQAIQWRDEIAGRGELRYLINTEYHIDHISGNYFFPTTVVSHEGSREMFMVPIEQNLAYPEGRKLVREHNMDMRDYILYRFEKLDPENFYLAKDYQLRPPTVTYSERMTIHLGDHTFELMHLPGHTPYETAVYIPQERVIFTGDNVTCEVQPSIAQCCPLEWLESLKTIDALDFDIIVPGHGELCDKREIPEVSQFIQEWIDAVRNAIDQGMSKEEAAEKISFLEARYAIHPGAEQQRINVRHLYDVLSGTTA
jgi:cyclase